MPRVIIDEKTPAMRKGTYSRFVSSENGRTHIGENPDHLQCRQFHVDGGMFPGTDGERCDYLLLNDDGKDAYFIELKGGNSKKAVSQIESTIHALKDSLEGYNIFQRIICSNATHGINDQTIVRWKRKNKGKIHNQDIAVIKENQYIDTMLAKIK